MQPIALSKTWDNDPGKGFLMAENGAITAGSDSQTRIRKFLVEVGIYVRRLRGEMSESDFAQKTGVSRTTVQRIEAGENFEIDSLLKIANALKINPFLLLMSEEERLNFDARFQAMMKSQIEQTAEAALKKIREDLPELIRAELGKLQKRD